MNLLGSGSISGTGTILTEDYVFLPYSVDFVVYDPTLPANQTGDAPEGFPRLAGETFIVPGQGNMVRIEQAYQSPPGGGNIIITDVNIPLYGWTDGYSLYFPGDIYTMPNSNVTMRAIWQTRYTPNINGISPDFGSVGDTVTIYGNNLGSTTQVKFFRNKPTSFTVINDNEITAIVPVGATTGSIFVTLGSSSSGIVYFEVE